MGGSVGGRRRFRVLVVAVVLILAVLGCSGGSGQTPEPKASSTQAARPPLGPARIVTTTHVSGRVWDLAVASPAVGNTVNVRLLLPAGFKAEPKRRWPALYLLHGCCDTYQSWTRSTDIERRTEDLDAVVVMPDGGPAGFYSDWRDGPGWETFHLSELPDVLAGTYRTGTPRVIAGVSMGGLGALGYAARHPGMFRVAASFSGIVDTRLSPRESQAYVRLVRSQGEDPRKLWGDPVQDAQVWKDHNPLDLAPRLRGTKLFVSAGDGRPGPLDPGRAGLDEIEASLRVENDAFAARVKQLGLDAEVSLYTPGTHSWAYWQRELTRSWPLITAGLGLR